MRTQTYELSSKGSDLTQSGKQKDDANNPPEPKKVKRRQLFKYCSP